MSVKIYTTPSCVYCRMTKDYFKKNNISYEEMDVQNDVAAREAMIEKSHQMGVPVIDINGRIIVGFNRPEIDQILGL